MAWARCSAATSLELVDVRLDALWRPARPPAAGRRRRGPRPAWSRRPPSRRRPGRRRGRPGALLGLLDGDRGLEAGGNVLRRSRAADAGWPGPPRASRSGSPCTTARFALCTPNRASRSNLGSFSLGSLNSGSVRGFSALAIGIFGSRGFMLQCTITRDATQPVQQKNPSLCSAAEESAVGTSQTGGTGRCRASADTLPAG